MATTRPGTYTPPPRPSGPDGTLSAAFGNRAQRRAALLPDAALLFSLYCVDEERVIILAYNNLLWGMMSHEEVYKRLQVAKKQKAEAAKMIRDELANNAKYVALTEELKKIKDEIKSIQNEVRNFAASEAQKLDELTTDIKADTQILTDIVVSKFMAGETVEIVDENNQKWVPAFSVRFQKDH